MSWRRGILWLFAGIALALLGGRVLADLYAEWAFHHALGTDAVWRSALLTGAALRLAVFGVAFAFTLVNFLAVRRSIVSLILPRTLGNLQIPEEIPPSWLTGMAAAGAFLIAALFALVDQDWTVARLAFSGLPFREADPYLERDLGFFVNWLPFERLWQGVCAVLLLVTTLLVVSLYAITPSVRWNEQGFYVSAWVRRHMGILGSLAILMIAWDWRLDRFALLIDGGASTTLTEAFGAFSAYEHRILMPYLVVLAFLALPAAVLFALGVWRGNLRLAFGIAFALLLGGPVARVILPTIAAADSNEERVGSRDRPYRSTRALYTRRAYAIDAIARPETLQLAVLDDSMLARQVSAWDPAALIRHLELERRATNVTAFAWQGTREGLEAILLRAAPLDAPTGARWPLDRIDTPASSPQGAPVDRPGAGAQGVGGVLVEPDAARSVVVADTSGRLAAPRFETTFQRVAHAWSQQNPRLLAAGAPTLRPRIMLHRAVHDRLARIAPFFAIGNALTPVIRNDSLYWIAELFAVAHDYPLSERLPFAGAPTRYVRHAATAVVQAQTGRIGIYPVADPDPVTRTWMGIFPWLFTDRDDAPSWLATALPPVVELALAQGTILGRTGFFGDSVAMRGLARVDDADADLTTGPPTLFQLDAAGTPGWGVPVVDAGDRITGLLVARGGASPRTEFHPLVPERRWTEVLERLQAAADSAGFGRSLPNARRGRVQSVPVVAGVAFVQSFYEWPSDGPPRLAGVVLLTARGTRVGRTVRGALGVREPAGGRAPTAEVFRAQVAALYDALGAALRAGDWRAYGEAWAALGRLLGRPAP